MARSTDVETLLRLLGIRAKRQGRKWVAKCPDPAHNDNDPSWSIVDNEGSRRHASHHCFSCGFGGGPWELAAAIWDEPVDEAGKKLSAMLHGGKRKAELPNIVVERPARRSRRVFKLPIGTIIPGPGGEWYGPALDYLTETRRVPRWQIDKWGIGYAIRGRLRGRVVLPVYTAGELVTYSARAFIGGIRRYDAGREVFGARPKRAVFGEPFFDSELDTATIAEGAFSTLALERGGFPNPGGILSSEFTPGRARIFDRFERIVIATDPDKAGEKVAKFISVLGRRARVDRLELPASADDIPDDELADIRRAFFA